MAEDIGSILYGDASPANEPSDSNLSGSTGKNDGSSIWSTGLLSGVTSLTNTAVNVVNAVKGKPAAAKPAAAAQASWQKYLPWIIGGVALLLVLGVVFKRK